MGQRELIWSKRAAEEFEAFIDRRTNKELVMACVEEHLLAVAADQSIAPVARGPLRELVYRFQCKDGDVTL